MGLSEKIATINNECQWIISTPNNLNDHIQGTSSTAKLETCCRNAFEQKQNLLAEIEKVKIHLAMVWQWTVEDHTYQSASTYL